MSRGTVLLVLQASIVLTVLALGLRTRREDVLYLSHESAMLTRSLVAMLVVMPLLALLLAGAFALDPAVKGALVALAVSPVPPLLPRKQLRAGGHGSYAVGLFVTTALFSIVTVPLAVHVVGGLTGGHPSLPTASVAKVVLISVIGPLAVGVVVRSFAPGFADRVARPTSVVAMVLLVAGCVPLAAELWRPMRALVGNGTLLAIVVFAVVGLVTGHLLGGPAREDRVVLALSTPARHPVVAITTASALLPGPRDVVPAVLLYLLVCFVLSAVYIQAFRRTAARVPPDVSAPHTG